MTEPLVNEAQSQELLMKYFNSTDPQDFIPSVWKAKYAAPEEETPEDMHWRMAREFARVRFERDKSKTEEEWATYFFEWFEGFTKIIPQGRIMAGLGRYDSYRSLSNCLRLPPPKDSINSIWYTDAQMANSAKRGCGYGLGLSNTRPAYASTTNAAESSTGVESWLEQASDTTQRIGQKGRRGACLADLDIRHPDAPMFSTIKRDKSRISGANISFKVWDDFMEAMEKKESYILRFPVDTKLDFNTHQMWSGLKESRKILTDDFPMYYYPSEKVYTKVIDAKSLWDTNIRSVWECGDAGLQFWDRMLDYDPANVYPMYRVDGTNACGEQPMPVHDTCRLIVQNLLAIVKNIFTSNADIDWDLLYKMSYELVLLGADLVALEAEYLTRIIKKVHEDPEPIEEKIIEITLWKKVRDMAVKGRRMGCGITGLGDMLAGMGLKYDSPEAIELVDKVMKVKLSAEYKANIDLAKEHGSFEGWDWDKQFEELEDGTIIGKNGFYQYLTENFLDLVRLERIHGRYSSNWNTIAPTGTTSVVAAIEVMKMRFHNISSGCEPSFSVVGFRNRVVQDGEEYDFINEAGIRFKTYPTASGAFLAWYYTTQGSDATPFAELSKDEVNKLYELSPWFGSLAGDIDYHSRIEMQAVLQNSTTSAISSTINVSADTDEQVISDIYVAAWKAGLKGITVYRDGSKGGVLIHEKLDDNLDDKFIQNDAPKRPKELDCEVHNTSVMHNKFSVVVGLLDDKPYEVFALTKSFKRGEGKLIKENRGRYTLESDSVTNEDIADGMTDEQATITRLISTALRHGTSVKFLVEQLNKTYGGLQSYSKAIARVLKKYIAEDEEASGTTCENCGANTIVYKEGCQSCTSCGSSKC